MKRILSFFILFLCYSCICNEETFYLGKESVVIFPYENTSSVTFIDNNEDLVVFDRIRYDRGIYEESRSPGAPIVLGPSCDDSFEEIQVSMNIGDNYGLYISTRSGFEASIVDYTTGGFGNYYTLNQNEYISNYSVGGVIYDEVLRVYNDFNSADEVILVEFIGVVAVRFGDKSLILEN